VNPAGYELNASIPESRAQDCDCAGPFFRAVLSFVRGCAKKNCGKRRPIPLLSEPLLGPHWGRPKFQGGMIFRWASSLPWFSFCCLRLGKSFGGPPGVKKRLIEALGWNADLWGGQNPPSGFRMDSERNVAHAFPFSTRYKKGSPLQKNPLLIGITQSFREFWSKLLLLQRSVFLLVRPQSPLPIGNPPENQRVLLPSKKRRRSRGGSLLLLLLQGVPCKGQLVFPPKKTRRE